MKPIFYGILNAVVPGASYVILRKRQFFGVFVLISSIALITSTFFEPTGTGFWDGFFFATTVGGRAFEAVGILSAMIAFFYDAYSIANEKASRS